jgi:hypothetical protein
VYEGSICQKGYQNGQALQHRVWALFAAWWLTAIEAEVLLEVAQIAVLFKSILHHIVSTAPTSTSIMAAPKKRSREQDDEDDRGEGSSGGKTAKKAAISQNGLRDSISSEEEEEEDGTTASNGQAAGINNKKMQKPATKSGQTAGNKQRKATVPSAAAMVKEAVRNKGKSRETPAENGQQDTEDMAADDDEARNVQGQSGHITNKETTRMQREIARLRVDNEQVRSPHKDRTII